MDKLPFQKSVYANVQTDGDYQLPRQDTMPVTVSNEFRQTNRTSNQMSGA